MYNLKFNPLSLLKRFYIMYNLKFNPLTNHDSLNSVEVAYVCC